MTSSGPLLAYSDSGGPGRPVIFLHGAACNLAHWSAVLPELRGGYRTITVDLPGHGHSPASPGWSWSAALGAIEALVDELALERPAIVGHSLGGMLAALWCAAPGHGPAINLDGHGGATAEIVSLDPALAADRVAELRSTGLARLPERLSVDETGVLLAEPLVERSLDVAEDGGSTFRPTRALMASIYDQVEALRLTEVYGAATSPLLVVTATAETVPIPGPDWLGEVSRLQRQRVAAELAAITNPLVSWRAVDATHGLLIEAPALTAAVIDAFLGANA